jgi:hypothetical protein
MSLMLGVLADLLPDDFRLSGSIVLFHQLGDSSLELEITSFSSAFWIVHYLNIGIDLSPLKKMALLILETYFWHAEKEPWILQNLPPDERAAVGNWHPNKFS